MVATNCKNTIEQTYRIKPSAPAAQPTTAADAISPHTRRGKVPPGGGNEGWHHDFRNA
jgi:hypothetical protein